MISLRVLVVVASESFGARAVDAEDRVASRRLLMACRGGLCRATYRTRSPLLAPPAVSSSSRGRATAVRSCSCSARRVVVRDTVTADPDEARVRAVGNILAPDQHAGGGHGQTHHGLEDPSFASLPSYSG